MENQKSNGLNIIRKEQEAINTAAIIGKEEYDIDTSIIYYELRDKWEKYDINFLNNDVRKAVEETHRKKQIANFYDDGTLEMKRDIKAYMPNENANNFWNRDCYIGGRKYNNFYIVAYDTPCVVRREDDFDCFDLLFAIQFSLTPLNKSKKFLNYHLEKSFKKNISEFAEFLEILLIQYDNLFKDRKGSIIVNKYFTDKIKKQVSDEELIKCRQQIEVLLKKESENFQNLFKISEKKGAKIDLIRILNALYELKLIENKNGQLPNKGYFMKQSGKFFGTDLSKYHTSLSQAMKEQPLEVNLKVFEEMELITKEMHYSSKKQN